jgi:hypothetical protein
VPRVDAVQELALVEAEADRVVGLPLPRRPGGPLPGHDLGEALRIRDRVPVDLLVEAEPARLVREQLPDRDVLLAGPGELGPAGGDPLVLVEPSAGVRDGEGHGRQALRGRVDDHHRVGPERHARRPVPPAAPQVDDPLAVPVDAARAAQLAA